MLSKEDIMLILNLLKRRSIVVTVEGSEVKVREERPASGYSDIPEIGRLQAKLSIMLEAASRAASKR